MIFKDVVNYYNELAEENKYLLEFRNEILSVKNKYNQAYTYILNTIVSGQINAGNMPSIVNQDLNIVNNIQVEARKVNLMKIGKVISKIDQFGNFEDSKSINNLISSVEDCSNCIFHFSNTLVISMAEITDLIRSIDTAIKEIDDIFYKKDFLNNINSAIESNECVYEESATLAIRMYRSQIELSEMANYMTVINNIYERTCTIFNVSPSEYKLIPIKIESGSWYEKLLGNSKVVGFVIELLNRCISYIYRNYTAEGKLGNQENKIETLMKEIKLIDLCEEHGIDTETAKQELKDNLNVLCADTYKLTTGNNKIAINDKIYDIGCELSQALLENSNKKYIDSHIDTPTQE